MSITISVEARGRNGVLRGKLTPAVYDIARELPGRRRWRERELVFEMSRANIEFIRERLPDAVWDTKRLEEIDKLAALEEDARTAKVRELPPEASSFRYKTEPREHQKRAFMISRDREAFGLFLEQGLGKTKVILDNAAHLWAIGKIDTLLVVAPNGVHAQWIDEQIPLHLPDWVKYSALVYTSNVTVKWSKKVEETFAFQDGLKVFAMHQEAFATKKGIAFAERVLCSGRALWALDESVSIKTPGAKRTMAIMKLRDAAPYRRILSGAPITKGIEDLFSQLRFLSDDVHGFSSFYTFRNRYCITVSIPGATSRFAVEIVGYQNLDEFKKRLDGWTIRATAAECLDLPERTRIIRPIEMTGEQKKLYNEMKEDFLAQLESGEIVTADQAVVKLLRLQQILCGHVKDENGELHLLKSNRAAGALAVAEEAQGKVVHWARFHADIDSLQQILAKAGRHPVTWDGRTSIEDRLEAKRRFINDDECRDFVANPGSAGTGVDGLQEVAQTMCYYSNSFKASERWQSEARLFRDGQKGTVIVVDLVVPGTVDSHVLNILQKREDVARNALDVRDTI